MQGTLTSNQTGNIPARVAVHVDTFVASFDSAQSAARQRPRIIDDPLALMAAGEALNRGLVVELHPEDVMPALRVGLRLAEMEREFGIEDA